MALGATSGTDLGSAVGDGGLDAMGYGDEYWKSLGDNEYKSHELKPGGSTDAFGKSLSELAQKGEGLWGLSPQQQQLMKNASKSSGETLKNATDIDPYDLNYGAGTKVMGMPQYYSPLADPFNRVYTKTFESDIPIVFLSPGTPKLNKKLVSANSKVFRLADTIGGAIDVMSFGVTNLSNYNDARFISFNPNYTEYYKYVSTMLRSLHEYMGLPGIFEFHDEYKQQKGTYGIAFYATKGTSISDSQNNSYGTSTLASEANSNAQKMREYRQMTALTGGVGNFISNIASGILDIITGIAENIPFIGNLISPFSNTLNGSQMYYPQIWNDSTYERSYTLKFNFYSPYGDRESIFRYVYIPLISLLAMALPRQDGVYGYKEPFLVRVSSPGWFECECGAITGIEISRGGDDSLWTLENFPSEIECSLQVMDLYPALVSTKSFSDMKYNIGLSSWLECCAGLRFDELSWELAGRKLAGKIKNKIASIGDVLTLQSFRNWWNEDSKQKTANKINNWLR